MPVDLRMSQDARCSDAGKEERRWGSSEAGGKKDGGVFFFYFTFFFYHIFVVKVQEIAWSTSYGQNKTLKQSNGLLHLFMGQTNTPRP